MYRLLRGASQADRELDARGKSGAGGPAKGLPRADAGAADDPGLRAVQVHVAGLGGGSTSARWLSSTSRAFSKPWQRGRRLPADRRHRRRFPRLRAGDQGRRHRPLPRSGEFGAVGPHRHFGGSGWPHRHGGELRGPRGAQAGCHGPGCGRGRAVVAPIGLDPVPAGGQRLEAHPLDHDRTPDLRPSSPLGRWFLQQGDGIADAISESRCQVFGARRRRARGAQISVAKSASVGRRRDIRLPER